MSEPKQKKKLTFNQRLLLAIVISILVHILFLISFAFPWIIIFPQLQLADRQPEPKREIEKTFEFELVETPDDADIQPKPKETRFVSDKSANARDNNQNNLPEGDAFADGQFDVSEYLEGEAPKNVEAPPLQPPIEEKTEELVEDADDKPPEPAYQKNDQFASTQQDPRRRNFLNLFKQQNDRRPLRKRSPLRRQNQTSTRNFGGFSLNTYAWNWAPYLQAMKDKIDRHLFPPAAFSRMGLISGDSLIRFKVYPDGHVEMIEVVETKGHRSLMETSLNSIKGAEPFRPLPADFPRDKEYLEVTAHFQYFISR